MAKHLTKHILIVNYVNNTCHIATAVAVSGEPVTNGTTIGNLVIKLILSYL